MRVRSYSLTVAVSALALALALAGCSKHDRREIEHQVNGGGHDHGQDRGQDHGQDHGRHHRHGEQPAPAQPSAPQPAPAPAPAPAPSAAPAPAAPAQATNNGAHASTPPAAAGELPLIFDQLEKPDYRAAYLPLFSNMARIPKWIRQGGTASPGHVVTIGRTEYELYSHCKPHDCGDNMMYVLFSRDLKHAWALLRQLDKFRYFGNPDATITAALKGAACKDLPDNGC